MSARTFLDELATRLRLALGSPTLILLVFPDHDDLDQRQEALTGLLSDRGISVHPIKAASEVSTEGPARWGGIPKDSANVFSLVFAPGSSLALRPALRAFNAQREDLRSLPGPLLLLITQRTERELRQRAPDFYTWTAERYAAPPDLDQLLAEHRQSAAPSPARLATPPRQRPPLRFLHISDLHLRPDRRYDQDRVLRGLLDMLRRQEDTLDLIFVTGDLASAGKPREYQQVLGFLRELLGITRVEPHHLFLVPGNHDVDRDAGRWLLRTLGSDDQSIAFFTKEENRRWHLEKFSAYRAALAELFGEDHGRPAGLGVGASAVEVRSIRGIEVAIGSFNSAWFAQGDDDQQRLWLGEANIDEAGRAVSSRPDVSVAIALLHHPLEWLAEEERDAIENYLDRSFDIVLRGHLHRERTRAELSGRGGFLNVAAAAAYQGSRWPNGCFLGEIDVDARSVRLSPYAYGSGADPWTLDTKVFPYDADHRHTFTLPPRKERETPFLVKLAPALLDGLLSLDERRMDRILGDLDIRTDAGGRRTGRAQAALDLLRNQGRLGELWDALLGVETDWPPGVVLIVQALGKQLSSFGALHAPTTIDEVLSGFGDLWRREGREHLAHLRHARTAPQLLFLTYLHSLPNRTSLGWSDSAGMLPTVTVTVSLQIPTGNAQFAFLLQRAEAPDPHALTAAELPGAPPFGVLCFLNRPIPDRAELSAAAGTDGTQRWILRLQL